MRMKTLKPLVLASLLVAPVCTFADEADGDEAFVVEVVGKMTALSLYNRQINIEDHAATEEDKAQLREAFIAALSDGCAADKNALLGGVVDSAVKSSLGL